VAALFIFAAPCAARRLVGGVLKVVKVNRACGVLHGWQCAVKRLIFLLPFAGSNLKEGEKYGALAALLLHFLAHNMYARRVWRGIKAAHFKELLKDEDY